MGFKRYSYRSAIVQLLFRFCLGFIQVLYIYCLGFWFGCCRCWMGIRKDCFALLLAVGVFLYLCECYFVKDGKWNFK